MRYSASEKAEIIRLVGQSALPVKRTTGDPDELKEDAAPATTATDGLRCFVEAEVLPCFETRKKKLANPPLIRTRHSARRST